MQVELQPKVWLRLFAATLLLLLLASCSGRRDIDPNRWWVYTDVGVSAVDSAIGALSAAVVLCVAIVSACFAVAGTVTSSVDRFIEGIGYSISIAVAGFSIIRGIVQHWGWWIARWESASIVGDFIFGTFLFLTVGAFTGLLVGIVVSCTSTLLTFLCAYPLNRAYEQFRAWNLERTHSKIDRNVSANFASEEKNMAAEDESSKPPSSPKQSFWTTIPGILTALAGIIVAVAGLVKVLGEYGIVGSPPRGSPLAASSASPTAMITSQAESTSIANIRGSLIELIEVQQARYVRTSWGVNAEQNFSDDDLKVFHSTKVLDKMEAELKVDPHFLTLAKTVRSLPAGERDAVSDLAAAHYKPTWRKIGKIDPAGQTEAGQQAEREIAARIVSLVRSQ